MRRKQSATWSHAFEKINLASLKANVGVGGIGVGGRWLVELEGGIAGIGWGKAVAAISL